MDSSDCRCLMDSHSNEVSARVLGIVPVATEFRLGCCDYNSIYDVVSSFRIVVGSEIATLCVC